MLTLLQKSPCYKRGATVQQRFASVYIVSNQISNLTFGGVAVAFLMLFFLSGLHDTDNSNDDADNRHNNTYNAHYYF